MKNDLTTGAWQHDIGCPISITLLSTSDEYIMVMVEIDSNTILVKPVKNRKDTGMIRAYNTLLLRLK